MKKIIFCLMACFLGSCAGSDNQEADGGLEDGEINQDIDSQQNVEFETIFSSADITVFSERMHWSKDDSQITFAGAPADVFRVAAQKDATPVKVTMRTEQDWSKGGFLPNFLGDDRIVYYIGPFDNDNDMHLMVAGSTQVQNDPAPSILQRYNGSDVGLGLNYASSPSDLSVAAEGSKAIAGYNGQLYTLDWSSGTLATNAMGTAGQYTQFMLTSDGTRICFFEANTQVGFMDFDGSNIILLGPGSSPTWSWDGLSLGYLDQTTENYLVYDLETQTTKSYPLPPGAFLEVSLSSDASQIAVRSFGGANTGIRIGTLQ